MWSFAREIVIKFIDSCLLIDNLFERMILKWLENKFIFYYRNVHNRSADYFKQI